MHTMLFPTLLPNQAKRYENYAYNAGGNWLYTVSNRATWDLTNSAYLNDHCLSPFDCIGFRDFVAESGWWGVDSGIVEGVPCLHWGSLRGWGV